MAKYTELLAEYLKCGGNLPAAFDNITGFKDLFIGRYIEREIGFETPELFQIKLEYKANLLIPIYQQRIAELTSAYSLQNNPIKTRTRTGELERDYGKKENSNTIQPYTIKNSTTNYPSAGNVGEDRIPSNINEVTNSLQQSTNIAEEYTDKEKYNNITDKEEGATLSEALQRLQVAERDGLKNLLNELLEEFEPLFMRIW